MLAVPIRVAARVVVARVASIVAAASAISEGVYLPSPTRAHRLRSPRARSPPPDKIVRRFIWGTIAPHGAVAFDPETAIRHRLGAPAQPLLLPDMTNLPSKLAT